MWPSFAANELHLYHPILACAYSTPDFQPPQLARVKAKTLKGAFVVPEGGGGGEREEGNKDTAKRVEGKTGEIFKRINYRLDEIVVGL